MEEKELQALIKLLDDRDDKIYRIVRQKLLNAGDEVIPVLKEKRKTTVNEFLKKRLNSIIRISVLKSVRKEMKAWGNKKDNDLLYGAFLVAKSQYPEIKFESIKKKIDKIADEIRSEFKIYFTALYQIRIINHILFVKNDFKGNFKDFYNPEYSFINKAVKDKKGCNIILSVIYKEIAKKLNLPVFITNFPQNMLLAFIDKRYNTGNPKKDVFFYLNPLNKGVIITKKDIDVFLDTNKITREKDYYLPTGNTVVIKRLLKHLIQSYKKMNKPNRAKRFTKLLKAIK